MARIHYTYCPICGSPDLRDCGPVKDLSVSGESFPLVECGACTLRFTQDVPDGESIGPYYKSEDYVSHTNTTKGLINRLYHLIRRRTLRAKRRLVFRSTGVAKGNLLDVGSGVGAFVDEVKKQGWDTVGLEPDDTARRVAKEQYGVELSTIERFYQLPAGSFDAITLWHVLEHVHDLHPYVAQLKNLLKENGRIFIAVPNYTSYDAGVYGPYWAAYDIPRHLYHFSPKSVQVLMERNGLEVHSHRPMWYDSFYISLLSSKYKNGHTRWIAAAWNGLRSNLKAMGNVKQCSSVIYMIGKSKVRN